MNKTEYTDVLCQRGASDYRCKIPESPHALSGIQTQASITASHANFSCSQFQSGNHIAG